MVGRVMSVTCIISLKYCNYGNVKDLQWDISQKHTAKCIKAIDLKIELKNTKTVNLSRYVTLNFTSPYLFMHVKFDVKRNTIVSIFKIIYLNLTK